MSDTHRWLLTRDFGFMWWSQVLSQVAEGVSKLALLWFVYAVTGSPLKTTVIGLLQTLPPILFGPFIGVLVDRFPKKTILITSDVARGLLIGLIPCLVPIEHFTVESLYVLTFLFGMATAVFVPTLSSAVPFMVARPQFTAANALLQSTTSLGIIIGPAVSGLGIAFSGSQDVLCVNALTYFASAACLLPIRLRATEQAPDSSAGWRPFIRHLLEGLRYAFLTHRTLLILIVLALNLIARLIAAFPDTVVGIKDSDGKIENMHAISALFPGFSVLAGADPLLLPVLQGGGRLRLRLKSR